MVRETTLEWESKKSRDLMQVLARDNGKFLYDELRKIARYHCRRDQREDFLHNFFIDITGRAHSYCYDINSAKSIHEDANLKAWVISSYRNFRVAYYKKEERRIQKEYKTEERAEEVNLERVIKGDLRLVDSACYRLKDDWYRICMEGSEYPGQGMIDIEEKKEIKRRKREVARVIQEAMNQLRENRREIVQLYYFDGLSTKEIGKRLGISPSNVTSQLLFARRDLMEILPYSIAEKRGWVEIRKAA